MANKTYQVEIGGARTNFISATEACDAFRRGANSGVPCMLHVGDQVALDASRAIESDAMAAAISTLSEALHAEALKHEPHRAQAICHRGGNEHTPQYTQECQLALPFRNA